MDVKPAFLYRKLNKEEDIYLRPPQGIELQGIKPEEALKLQVCIYELKQAAKRWYETYMEILIKIGFKRSNKDEEVFYWKLPNSLAIIFIHIDDSGIITRTVKEMIELKNQIKSHLECDDMSELS